MNQIIARLSARFNPDSISAWVYSVVPHIITATITFLVFWLLWKTLSRALDFTIEKTDLDQTLSGFFEGLLKYIVLGTGFLAALSELGINTSSLIASLGVAGLTIGFAAKDTLSNLISGLFIFWDRPFGVGDIVEINGKYGKVSVVTLRSTRVVTPDGKMIAFPNSKVINSPVTSYTNFPHLKISTSLSFPASTNPDEIRKDFALLIADDKRFMSDPSPMAEITQADSGKLEFCFSAWIKDEKSHLTLENELKETIFFAFKEKII